MHILYIHQYFTTPSGAGGTRSYEFAKRLIQRGHKVTMVCGSYRGGSTGLVGDFINGKRQGNVEEIEVIEFDLPYSNHLNFRQRSFVFLQYVFRCLGIVFKKEYDLIFATSTPLTVAVTGILAKIFRRKPFVFEVRDLWPEMPRSLGVIKNPILLKMLTFLENITYKTADLCIGLFPFAVEWIKRTNIPEEKIVLIPNGCDFKLFDIKESKVILRQKYRNLFSPDDFVAIYAGSHGMANGLPPLLDVAALLKEKGIKHIKLLFVGDGMMKSSLQSRAYKEGLDNCLFLDPMPKQSLVELMNSVDVGLLVLANCQAFHHSTSPNKFYDYIASELPVVCNYPGWISNMLEEFQCGIGCPPDHPISFANALIHLSENKENAKKFGENAKRLGKELFDRNLLSEKFVTNLENVGKKFYA